MKVRFNLGAGKHYMHWQVTSDDGSVEYYDPSEISLTIPQGKLINRPATARRIYDGAHKSVCAWIECDKVIATSSKPNTGKRVSYNPRVAPNWLLEGENVDGRVFNLHTVGNAVYVSSNEN